MLPDKDRIEKVLNQRLLDGPKNIKNHLYSLVGKDYGIYSLKTKDLLSVFILTRKEIDRVNDFEQKIFIPFPALYTTKEYKPAVFRLEKSRNVYLKSNTINNSIGLSVGEDCTIILEDHHQSITAQEVGKVEYDIGLGFLISFGKEIDEFNAYEYLDELIAYTIKLWRQNELK